mgnify:CR=1 FL=1
MKRGDRGKKSGHKGTNENRGKGEKRIGSRGQMRIGVRGKKE